MTYPHMQKDADLRRHLRSAARPVPIASFYANGRKAPSILRKEAEVARLEQEAKERALMGREAVMQDRMTKLAVMFEDSTAPGEVAQAIAVLREIYSRKFIKVGAVAKVVKHAARHYGVTIDDIMSASRCGKNALARQVAMFLAREITLKSFPELGRLLGGKDHSSVLHGWQKISAQVLVDQGLATSVNAVRAAIEADQEWPKAAALCAEQGSGAVG